MQLNMCPTGAGVSTNKLCNVIALQESCVFVDIFAFRLFLSTDVCQLWTSANDSYVYVVRAGKLSVLQWLVSSPDELPVCRPSDDVAFVIKTGMQLRSRLCFALFFCRVSCLQPVTSDVNKTKTRTTRPRPEWQDPRPGFLTTAVRTIHVLLIIKTVSVQYLQELSYRKQIARQLRTQCVEGIHRPKYYTVTLKCGLEVTQGGTIWKLGYGFLFAFHMAVSAAILVIFSVKEWPDLEIWVRGPSRSLKMARFDRPCMTFC